MIFYIQNRPENPRLDPTEHISIAFQQPKAHTRYPQETPTVYELRHLCVSVAAGPPHPDPSMVDPSELIVTLRAGTMPSTLSSPSP